MVFRARGQIVIYFFLLRGESQHLGKIRAVLVQSFRVQFIESGLAA